jgi:hypothetical protein
VQAIILHVLSKRLHAAGEWNVKVMSVNCLLSFQTECITKDGHQRARISPHFLNFVWTSYQQQTLFGVEWRGKIAYGKVEILCKDITAVMSVTKVSNHTICNQT